MSPYIKRSGRKNKVVCEELTRILDNQGRMASFRRPLTRIEECAVASCTQMLKTRDRMKKKAAGKKRKKALAKKGTTPSRAVLFGDDPQK